MTYKRLRDFFNSWGMKVKRAKERRHKLRVAAERIRRRSLSKALQGWKTNILQKIREKNMTLRIITRMQKLKKRSAFQGWAQAVKIQQEIQSKLRKVKAKANRIKKTFAFRRWRNKKNERLLERQKLTKALARMQQIKRFAALQRWKGNTGDRRDARRMIARALALGTLRVLRLRLVAWKCTTALMRRKAIKEKKMKYFTTRMRHRKLDIAFATWVSFSCERRRFRQLRSRAINRLVLLRKTKVLNAWVTYIESRTRARRGALRVRRPSAQNRVPGRVYGIG